MLPNIDAGTTAVGVGTQPQPWRADQEKAVEAYQTPKLRNAYEESSGARAAETVRERQKPEPASATQILRRKLGQDVAEMGFLLTREEREVFVNAASGREKPEEMTGEEQDLLQKTSERLEKLLDEAMSRQSENRERIDTAVKEWYLRLSNGKREAGEDLLHFIRKAARGELKSSS